MERPRIRRLPPVNRVDAPEPLYQSIPLGFGNPRGAVFRVLRILPLVQHSQSITQPAQFALRPVVVQPGVGDGVWDAVCL